MNDKSNHVHWSFWIICVVTLLWNFMGGINFFIQMDADSLVSFPETHQAIILGRPVWATVGFAIAVFGGTLGCLLLLLKKSAALYVFVASLFGVILAMIHTLSLNIDFNPFELVMMILMPFVVAVFLICYSMYAKRKNWI